MVRQYCLVLAAIFTKYFVAALTEPLKYVILRYLLRRAEDFFIYNVLYQLFLGGEKGILCLIFHQETAVRRIRMFVSQESSIWRSPQSSPVSRPAS